MQTQAIRMERSSNRQSPRPTGVLLEDNWILRGRVAIRETSPRSAEVDVTKGLLEGTIAT